MAQTVKLDSTACAPVSASEPDGEAALPSPGSRYEVVLQAGFPSLKFPEELERDYQRDEVINRDSVLRISLALAVALSIGLLLPDWLMVPDMLHAAVPLRLVVYVLPAMILLLMFNRVHGRWREWLTVITSSLSGFITVWLCVNSTDSLAPPYLVALSMVLLFNGGVMRMRFWPALVADLVIFLQFAIAVALLDPLPAVLMTAVALVLLSTAVFSLYGCYWQEHEERTNWLMLQHEHMLLAEIEHGNRRLDQLSRHDALTGLANRRHVDEFLQQVWDRARHAGDEVAVLMVDVDHFKGFNDHYGHPEGDACLRDVAQAIETHLRQPNDLAGRFGGEEFIAVLNQASLAAAVAAGERVREGVRQLARAHVASPNDRIVTISVGAASVRPGRHERNPQRLLALADEALYKAKTSGRDRVIALSDQG